MVLLLLVFFLSGAATGLFVMFLGYCGARPTKRDAVIISATVWFCAFCWFCLAII